MPPGFVRKITTANRCRRWITAHSVTARSDTISRDARLRHTANHGKLAAVRQPCRAQSCVAKHKKVRLLKRRALRIASSNVEISVMSKHHPPSVKFVTVQPPPLFGPRGRLYHLDNKPAPVPGRGHLEFRRRRKLPSPLFPAIPPIDFHPANAAQRSPLWERDSDVARSAISELVQQQFSM